MRIDEIIQATFSTSQHKAFVNLRYTSNYLNNRQNSFLAEFELSAIQYNILLIIKDSGKTMNMNQIKKKMIQMPNNLTRTMDKLLDKKLITRSFSKTDRREILVEITKKGMQLLDSISSKFDESALLIPENLTHEEAEQLSHLLDKVRLGLSK